MCGWDDCALVVLATVVSVPAENRAIIDAGSKTLTTDLLGLQGYGQVLGRPDIRIDQLSEEHGRLVTDGPIGLTVGDLVRVVPNHACVVSNMVDRVHILEDGQLAGTWPVVGPRLHHVTADRDQRGLPCRQAPRKSRPAEYLTAAGADPVPVGAFVLKATSPIGQIPLSD